MEKLKKIAGSVYAALLFALLAAHFTVPGHGLLSHVPKSYYHTGFFTDFVDRGKVLIYGIEDGGATYSMPLLSVTAAVALDVNSRNSINRLAFWLHFGIYLLCFLLGRTTAGPFGGLTAGLFALGATLALGNFYETEQLVYSFLIMLLLNVLAFRQERPGRSADALAGLAIGTTFMARSDLFLLPFAILLMDRLLARGKNAAAPAGNKFANAAVFLVFSYILLLPWMGVTYYLHKKVIPFESARGDCNIITGVLGSVYTMEGDCRKLAGLSPEDSALGWAAGKVISAPHQYALSVLKRLYHIFLFYPYLFPIALAGFLLCRRREAAAPVAALVLCFVLIHSLMSVEARYFYPLRFALAFLGALAFSRLTDDGKAGRPLRPALGVFALVMPPVLLLAGVLVSFPFRVKPELAALESAAAVFNDPWLWEKRGDFVFRLDRTADGLASYARALEISGGRDRKLAYIVATLGAGPAGGIKPPDQALGLDTPDLWLLKALKEMEFRDMAAARASFMKAFGIWNGRGNLLRGTPYDKDSEILVKIQGTNTFFWDYHVKNCLYFWAPEKRRGLVQSLSTIAPLTPELKKLLPTGK